MSQEAVEFDYDLDNQVQKNEYPCQSIDYVKINDSNTNNYSNGVISFNGVKTSGTDVNIQYSISKGTLSFPYTIVQDISAASFTSDGTNIVPDNRFACSVKSYHNMIESCSIKMGSTSLNEKLDNLNIIIGENLKRMSQEERLLYGSKMNYELDSASSYRYNSNFGEYNNVVRPSANANGKVDDINTGHMRRMLATNNYLGANSTDSLATLVGQMAMSDSLQPCMISNTPTQLVFTGIAVIPLCEIHDCFKQTPSMSKIEQLTLLVNTNLATSNSWTTVYSGGAQTTGVSYGVSGLIATQSYGSTCPVLLSNCGSASATGANASSLFGLTVYPNNANTPFRIKTTCKIGYMLSSGSYSGQTCQLSIPSYNMNPDYASKILEKGLHRMLYNEHASTWLLKLQTNGSVITKPIQGLFQRPRKLYVFPFLSKSNTVTAIDGNNSMVSPFQSPVSSAPLTCTPCRLYDCNIKIGQKNIFDESLKYSHEFYDEHVLESLGKINGNSIKSPFMTGLVDKSMWDRCYQVYVFNLSRSMNELIDNDTKEIYFSCKILGQTGLYYDLLCVVEHQKETNLDRASGLFSLSTDIPSSK